jgi:hypothetical protein
MNEEYQEGYSSGVWDTVALINENEDMTLNWRDIINALAIKELIAIIEGGEQ